VILLTGGGLARGQQDEDGIAVAAHGSRERKLAVKRRASSGLR
jgi:hypothetical protein